MCWPTNSSTDQPSIIPAARFAQVRVPSTSVVSMPSADFLAKLVSSWVVRKAAALCRDPRRRADVVMPVIDRPALSVGRLDNGRSGERETSGGRSVMARDKTSIAARQARMYVATMAVHRTKADCIRRHNTQTGWSSHHE